LLKSMPNIFRAIDGTHHPYLYENDE